MSSSPDPNDPHSPKSFDWGKTFAASRRDFLLLAGLVINAAAGALIGIPIIGFVISSVLKAKEPVWISLGPISQFPEGTTRMTAFVNPYRSPTDGTTVNIPCWVRRIEKEKFQVFAVNCTHLGCPVRWFEESKLFLCPCHGGAYYQDGAHAAGPPPRGLFVYDFKVESNELKIKGGVQPTLASPL